MCHRMPYKTGGITPLIFKLWSYYYLNPSITTRKYLLYNADKNLPFALIFVMIYFSFFPSLCKYATDKDHIGTHKMFDIMTFILATQSLFHSLTSVKINRKVQNTCIDDTTIYLVSACKCLLWSYKVSIWMDFCSAQSYRSLIQFTSVQQFLLFTTIYTRKFQRINSPQSTFISVLSLHNPNMILI